MSHAFDRVTLCRRDGSPVASGAAPVELDRARWLLLGPPSHLGEIAGALGRFCTHVAGTTLAHVDFGNAVGRFEVPHLGTVSVSSGKFGEGDFDHMLRELTEVAAGLPFSAGQSGGLPHERTALARRQVLYHAFVYLRALLSAHAPAEEALAPALEAVVREPHRRFERIARRVSVSQARGLTTASVARMASMPMMRAPGRLAGMPLARALRGHLPVEVDEPRVRSTFDTPENRLVKAFLERARFIVEATVRAAHDEGMDPTLRRRIEDDARAMDARLVGWLRVGLWREVGALDQVPAGSTVLQRQRGYREVFRAFVRLGLASRVPLDERAARDLLELKDIAQLYELWVYFRLVELLREVSGAPREADVARAAPFSVTVPWGYRVRWADGTELLYNASFSRTGRRRSWSVPLRPDVVLVRPDGALHVFDAKFRLRRLSAVGSDADRGERTTFERDDLVKMHAYRDALRGARSAWVVYPGSGLRHFGRSDGSSGGVAGVGAVGLRPGRSTGADRAVARLLHACASRGGDDRDREETG